MKKNAAMSSTGEKRGWLRRALCWIPAGLFLAAAVLVVCHLKPQPPYPYYALSKPTAAGRTAEAYVPAYIPGGEVGVNSATLEELCTVPGIGPVLAQSIIDERQLNGLFHYPEDLLCVRGIGEKTLLKLLPYLNLN